MRTKLANWGIHKENVGRNIPCSNSFNPLIKSPRKNSDNNFEDMDVLKKNFNGRNFSLKGFVKTFKSLPFKETISLSLVLCFLISCVPSAEEGGTRKNASLTNNPNNTSGGVDNGDFNDPSFPLQNSYIQNGFVNTYGQFQTPSDFEGALLLKGREIHNFLKVEANRKIAMCLLARFPGSTQNPLLLFSLVPQSKLISGTNTLERYYRFQSIDRTQNLSVCSSPTLVTSLATTYPGEGRAYLFDEVCTGCNSQLASSGIIILDSNGTRYDGLNTSLLSFVFIPPSNSNDTPGCTLDSQCTYPGSEFDCCLQGQCVEDKTIRPDVDQTSADFQTAALEVKQSPSKIFDYPEYYFICPSGSPPDQDTPADETPVDRMTKLERLYNCTSPQDNEVGLCTITYENAGDSIAASTAFSVRTDDTDFVDIWSGPAVNIADFESKGSIAKVEYAGKVLYDENHFNCMRAGFECYYGNACTNDATLCAIEKTPAANPTCTFDVNNNNVGSNSNIFADAQCIQIKTTFANPSNAPHDRLEITYRVDGSCERLNSVTAKCEKYYVQGQLNYTADDKSPGAQIFDLPTYADTSKQVTVFVDDVQVFEGSEWNLNGADVEFDTTKMQVYDNQVVKLQFFVDISGGKDTIFASQDAAQTEINSFCGCSGTLNCSLKAITSTVNGVETVTDYECEYPDLPTQDPPLEQRVYLSSKTVPVRYYDTGGALVDEIDANTNAQEGTAFSYTDGSKLQPNNIATYIGFNEIYGSLGMTSSLARPPQQIDVKKGRFYNIFTNSGALSSCTGCGNDYYSSLNRVFPDVFVNAAGGYNPDPFRTDRSKNLGWSESYRSDDLHFGRSCFLPATMIPWTHLPSEDLFTQRSNRMRAQHFLFANGYQRDWYGFDYGSIIGSFDGVKWFAIGSARQIKAETNKLYLAVNAYFGDIRPANGYDVRVNEVVSNISDFTIPTTDFETDAAQCQSYHICDTDQDCVTQLGWDYACENVSGIKTKWPLFNANGDEIPDAETSVTLRSLFGTNSGSSKRCVYRGRGSLCHGSYGTITTSTSYTGTDEPRFHGCSANNYCEAFNDGGAQAKFNTKIARYASSPKNQNLSALVPATEEDHTFGLGARLIGRPYKYNGTEEPLTQVITNIANNNASEMCIPGKNASIGSGSTFNDLNAAAPDTNDNLETGDIVGNIGVTHVDDATTDGVSTTTVMACPAFNEDGNLFAFESPGTAFDDATIYPSGFSQNLTTSSFNTFTNANDNISDELIKKFTSVIDDKTLQENRCLRAPGSACHTDFDCAPSSFVASVFKRIDPTSATDYNSNGYEVLFWQEELVCGQKSEKFSANYDLKLNRCCRETGKILTIGTNDPNAREDTLGAGNAFVSVNTSQPPGLDGAATDSTLNAVNRYSRVTTAYKAMNEEAADHPAMEVAEDDSCVIDGACGATSKTAAQIEKQFNTLDEIAGATCCTGHWIREFDDSNGGGHKWSKGKFQSIDKRNFECLNYIMDNAADPLDDCLNTSTADTCDCADPTDPTCKIRSIPLTESDRYNKFFSSLELVGIPNVIIQSDDASFEADSSAITCVARHDNNSQGAVVVGDPIKGTIAESAENAEVRETVGGVDYDYYKGSDLENFDSTNGIKKVFSEDEFTCCLPGGTEVSNTTPEKNCCTGNIADTGDGPKCCLPDYTNVTVYLNRYVSSEMKDFPDSDFDPKTGRPLSFAKVSAFAKNICCSGKFAGGQAFGEMGIPFSGNSTLTVNRFVSGNRSEDNINNNATNYDRGLKWNTDVYCVPDN